MYKPHGKESTEVGITQKMKKERENSYEEVNGSLEERHT